MASAWNDLKFDDDAEEAHGADKVANTKDAVVVLIDARESMWQKNAKGEVFFVNALHAVHGMMKPKVINSDTDLVGVILFGTKETKNESAFDNVYELIPLGHPGAASIKQIQEMMEPDYDFSDIGAASSATAPLYHALWVCANAFAAAKLKDADQKRVWLFTNDDNPVTDAASKSQAIMKAKDMADVKQFVELFMMSKPGRVFDPSAFYASIVTESDSGNAMKDMSCLDEVLDEMRRKTFRKRVYARIPFTIADGLEFSVALYNNIYPSKKPSPVQLEARTNTALKVETNWHCVDTGTQLMPHQIRTYQEFGGEHVAMDKDDMKQVKYIAEPGMQLMGFKDRASVLAEHNMRAPYFLYPNEDGITGSTVAFHAMLQKLHEMDKVAIVRLITRAASSSRLCALLPQPCERDDEGFMEKPPGMHVIPLPYADDIRFLQKVDEPVKPTADQVAKAKAVVQLVNLKNFLSYDFPNPVLAKHYAWVQALALDEDAPGWTEKDDVLVPCDDDFAKLADEIAAFRESIGGYKAGEAPTKARTKRTAGGGAAGGAKKSRAAAAAAAAGPIDAQAMLKSGTLAKLKVAELKSVLTGLGLPVSGRKQVLIDRISEHYGQ